MESDSQMASHCIKDGSEKQENNKRNKKEMSWCSLGCESVDKDKVGKECPEQDERLCA